MQAYKLISAGAAALLTFASLSALLYSVNDRRPTSDSSRPKTVHVTNLAPVMVHPSAAERRAAALLSDTGEVALATRGTERDTAAHASPQSFDLLGSQLVMPYYSFGNKFGRITKE